MFLGNSWLRTPSVCLEVFGGRPDRGLLAGMTFWGRSRAAAKKVITDDLALLVRLQIFFMIIFSCLYAKILTFASPFILFRPIIQMYLKFY